MNQPRASDNGDKALPDQTDAALNDAADNAIETAEELIKLLTAKDSESYRFIEPITIHGYRATNSQNGT